MLRGIVLIATAVVIGLAGWQLALWPPVPPETALHLAPQSSEPEPPLSLPKNPDVVFLGDSWTVGYAAPEGQGYADIAARKLGWDMRKVPDGGGTGFLNPGPADAGTYLERLSEQDRDPAVDLVVIQGGLNDQGEPDLTAINDAAAQVLTVAERKFPNAELLMLGPLSPDLTGSEAVAQISDRLQYVAEQHSVPFISPTLEGWFSPDNIGPYIDEAAGSHPNAAGHRYLARRFIEAVEDLAADR